MAVGLYRIVQVWIPGTAIELEGGRVWGRIMFCILTGTMVILAMVQLPFLSPLLLFHFQLCHLTFTTGEFHSSYMYTMDRKTMQPRGRGAFLDERAKHTLEFLAHFHFMDQASGFHIWKEMVSHTKHLRDSQGVVEGMSSLNKQLLEMTSGIELTENQMGLRGSRVDDDDHDDPRRPLLQPQASEKLVLDPVLDQKAKQERDKQGAGCSCIPAP